jgi:uncharacterized integral membrane protein (TIGR00697 family)
MSHSSYKHLDTITGAFVAILLISNIASTKILTLGLLTFDGGTLLFPLSYIFGDVLTEVYGYAASRKVIWIGFSSALLMSIVLMIVGVLPPDPGWLHQSAYDTILGQTARIVVASLVAYFAGEFSNSYVLAKMKILTGGKYLWMRTIGSTLVGEGMDTVIFVLIAFAGVLEIRTLAAVVISNYVFKTSVEVLFTPLTYRIVGWLKKQESIDHYDRGTNFNPFRLFLT